MLILLLVPVLSGLVFWFFLSVIIGIAADRRGQSGLAFFAASVFLSPLLAGLLLWAMGERPQAIPATAAAMTSVAITPVRPAATARPHSAQTACALKPAYSSLTIGLVLTAAVAASVYVFFVLGM